MYARLDELGQQKRRAEFAAHYHYLPSVEEPYVRLCSVAHVSKMCLKPSVGLSPVQQGLRFVEECGDTGLWAHSVCALSQWVFGFAFVSVERLHPCDDQYDLHAHNSHLVAARNECLGSAYVEEER